MKLIWIDFFIWGTQRGYNFDLGVQEYLKVENPCFRWKNPSVERILKNTILSDLTWSIFANNQITSENIQPETILITWKMKNSVFETFIIKYS
jgi:hypothetical protein